MLARKSKGATLLEITICMFVISIMILIILTFQRVNLQSKEEEEKLRSGIFQVDAVKNILLSNLSYREIQDNFKNKVLYIHKEEVENNNIITKPILSIVDESIYGGYPFIKIQTQEDLVNQLMKVEIYYSFDEEKVISNVFYKGNYEK